MSDFTKWAVIGYNDDTGIGNQLDAIKNDIGISKHLVIPSEKLKTKPLKNSDEILVEKNTSESKLESMLQGVDILLFIEIYGWHQDLFVVAKKLKIKTVCLVNWEWFNPDDPNWRKVDFLAAATRYTISFLKRLGFSNLLYLPPPIRLEDLPERAIKGKGRFFFHNAGIIDEDDRKGTFAVIRAFSKVKNPEIKLLIRMQHTKDLKVDDSRIFIHRGNIQNRADLYREGDVAIQPSKLEGVGFNILEPVACGVPTITTDCEPMNEWVSELFLRVKTSFWKKKSFSNKMAGIKHAFLHSPSVDNLSKAIEWCASNDLSDISRGQRTAAISLFAKDKLRLVWRKELQNNML